MKHCCQHWVYRVAMDRPDTFPDGVKCNCGRWWPRDQRTLEIHTDSEGNFEYEKKQLAA